MPCQIRALSVVTIGTPCRLWPPVGSVDSPPKMTDFGGRCTMKIVPSQRSLQLKMGSHLMRWCWWGLGWVLKPSAQETSLAAGLSMMAS